jgi:hypothetical protein
MRRVRCSNFFRSGKPRGVWLAAVVLGGAGGGCQYETIRRAQLAHRDAAPEIAQADLAQLASTRFAGPHRVLGWLELGSADHAVGRHAASSRALLRAEAGFDAQDARARTSVTEELFAAVTSPLSVAYRGSSTDRVMAPTLRAVNAMLLGDDEGARLALNEAAFRQEENLRRNAAQIDRARGVPDERAGTIDVSRSVEASLRDPRIAASLGSLRGFEPYRGFVNPFAEMLHAVYRLGLPRDAADGERGLTLLRSVVGTTENRFAAEWLAELGTPGGGRSEAAPTAPSVHIFYATGFCPIREEIRLDLPLFLVNDTVDYAGVAFPRLAFDERAPGSLVVETPGAMARTEVLADMDRLMGAEYRDELPVLLTRAVVSAAAKAAAAYGLNEATRDDETANAAARISTSLYQYSQNRADTRAWATLPKRYEYARVPAPPEGEVLLSGEGGDSAFVSVSADTDTIVFVRSMHAGVGFTVRSVVLGAAGETPGDEIGTIPAQPARDPGRQDGEAG